MSAFFAKKYQKAQDGVGCFALFVVPLSPIFNNKHCK
jgi:hypothetical protein